MSIQEAPQRAGSIWFLLALACSVLGVLAAAWLPFLAQGAESCVLAALLIIANVMVGVTAWRWRR